MSWSRAEGDDMQAQAAAVVTDVIDLDVGVRRQSGDEGGEGYLAPAVSYRLPVQTQRQCGQRAQ